MSEPSIPEAPEDYDELLENLPSRIDDIIDGNASFGRPGQAPADP